MTIRQQLARLLHHRRDLVGINRRNVELVYAQNPRKHYPIADDKLLCKVHLERAGVPVSRTIVTCDGLRDIPATLRALENPLRKRRPRGELERRALLWVEEHARRSRRGVPRSTGG